MSRPPVLGAGVPPVPGIYACRQWYGWRVLEWTGTKWAYEGRTAYWPNSTEPFEAWCGPLPPPSRAEAKPAAPVALEFDL